MTPTSYLRFVWRKESVPIAHDSQRGITTNEIRNVRVLQQFWAVPYGPVGFNAMAGEWRDVPLEEGDEFPAAPV